MMVLAGLLSLGVGVTLGLLGGGGSILMLPILVYVLGMAPLPAVTVSLLVVGATSLAGLVPHARAGRVGWGTGFLFGGAGMVGAFVGGRLAPHVPPALILVGFAVLLLATAFFMLRGKKVPEAETTRPLNIPRALIQGAGVGVVSGLVGAGGGFLVVPTLVLFGGLPMARAIGTSLLVITLQTAAGFVAHLGESSIDWGLAGVATVAAVAGGLIGGQFAGRVSQPRLRRAFAWLVLAIGVFMLAQQLPSTFWRALVGPVYRPLLGGMLIGLSAALLWLFHGRVAGISGIAGSMFNTRGEERAWRGAFIGGLLVGGAALRFVWPEAFAGSPVSLGLVVLAGLLVGVGTTLANGCTSGHGVCGISRLSTRSFAATASFMAAGALMVFVVRHLVSGGS